MEILSNYPRCTHPHLLMYHHDHPGNVFRVDDSVGSDSSHMESFIPCARDVTANAGTHADRVVMQIVVTDAISNVGVSVDDVGVKYTGENLDAVTAVTDSFKMADAFAGD